MINKREVWTAAIPAPPVGSNLSNFAPIYGVDNVSGLPTFRKQEVKGIVVHVTNLETEFVNQAPNQKLENIRKENLAQGYSDIVYNFAVTQNVFGPFVLRGLTTKGASLPKNIKDKENKDSNSQYISTLCLLGVNERPTDNLLNSLHYLQTFILSKFPEAKQIVMADEFQKTQRKVQNKTLNNILYTVENHGWENLEGYKEYKDTTSSCRLPSAPISYNYNSLNNSFASSVQIFDLLENLAYWNYYTARNDGIYGPLARHALKLLQADLAPHLYMSGIDGLYSTNTREAWCLYIKQLQKELVEV